MPRRTPVKELQKEEVVTSSPLRRSSRISNNSPVPTKVTTRRSSASETTSSTPQVTRGRRSSFTQELESVKEKETETKTTKTPATRTRRGSVSSKNGDDNATVEENTAKHTTRASSVTKEDTSDAKKPVTRRRRSASLEVEVEVPVTKITRSRSSSITKKNEKVGSEKTEDIVEETKLLVVDLGTPIKKSTLNAIEEATKESNSPLADESKTSAAKKKTDHMKVDLDLSVIKETSYTEDVASEEERKSVSSKSEEDKETQSEVKLVPVIEEKDRTERILSSKKTEESVEIALEEKEKPETSLDISNVRIEKNIDIEVPPVTSEKAINSKISVTPKKEITIVENGSTIVSESSNENEEPLISPQGNKENVRPSNKFIEAECEPMEVDEIDEASFTNTVNSQSPVLKMSKVKDVSKELEIAEKVTDEIDQFLKEEVKISTNSPNKFKKNRLSLNRSSNTISEKEDSVDENLKNETTPNEKIEQNVSTVKEKAQVDSKEGVEESKIQPEKKITEIVDLTNSKVADPIDEDSNDSFHLELTETKEDSEKIEEDIEETIADDSQEKESSTINETKTTENNKESASKADTEEINLEETDKNTLEKSKLAENKTSDIDINKSTVVEDHVQEQNKIDLNNCKVIEEHVEKSIEVYHSSVVNTDVNVAVKRTQLSPDYKSTPKTNFKDNESEDAVDTTPMEVTIETDEELEISKTGNIVKGSTEVENGSEKVGDVQKETEVNASSCIIVDSVTENEDTQSSDQIIAINEGKDKAACEPEERIVKETEHSLSSEEKQEVREENEVSLDNVKDQIEKPDSENLIDAVENTNEDTSKTQVEENSINPKTSVAVKKSPVVIIKSDILIKSGTPKDDSFEKTKISTISVSSEENFSGDIEQNEETELKSSSDITSDKEENDKTLEETDTTQSRDDDAFQQDYKSPQKKIRSETQVRLDSSDEESDGDTQTEKEEAEKEPTSSSPTVVIVSDHENEDTEKVVEEVTDQQEEEEDVKQVQVSSDSENEINEIVPNENVDQKVKKHSPDKTSIVMQHNIKAGEDNEKRLSDRIHKVVDLFCAGIKNTNDVSINVSLEFTGHFSDSDNESKKDTVEVALAASASKANSKEQPKGTKRRKLYHPGSCDVFDVTAGKECPEEEEVEKRKDNKKKKNKKSATFNEDSTSVDSPQKLTKSPNVDQEKEFSSPVKKSRLYKDTPYKSAKGNKRASDEGAGNKKESSFKSDVGSPEESNEEEESSIEVEETELDEFRKLFSSVPESNSETSEDHDSTWEPSRASDLNDSILSSDESEEDLEEEESFFIKSPILSSTASKGKRKTDSSEESFTEEPSFTYSCKSSKSSEVSLQAGKSNVKSPSPSKKRKSLELEDEVFQVESPEKKKISPGKETSEHKKEKTSKQATKNFLSIKPSSARGDAVGEKTPKKRTHAKNETLEESLEVKKPTKSQKIPEIVVSEVPIGKLKVSTKECVKAVPPRKSGKTAKGKSLKPSSSMGTNDWEVTIL